MNDYLPGYGVRARLKNSQRTTPKDQTSERVEKIPSCSDSNASQRTGKGPLNKTYLL
jgi:hypothetical protein